MCKCFTNRDRIVSFKRCVRLEMPQDGPDTDSQQIFSLRYEPLNIHIIPPCDFIHIPSYRRRLCAACIFSHVYLHCCLLREYKRGHWISACVCIADMLMCVCLKQGKWFSCTQMDHTSMKTAVIIRMNRGTPVYDKLSIAITHDKSYESRIPLLLCTWCQSWLCTYVSLIVPYIPCHVIF